MTLVTAPDVEAALLRPLTATETTYINRNIAAVEADLRRQLATVDDRIAAHDDEPRPVNAIDPVTVSSMLADVIARRLNNPKGLWSTSHTEGPLSESETYPGARGGDGAATAGGLVITPADLARLRPATTTARARTVWTRPPAPSDCAQP